MTHKTRQQTIRHIIGFALLANGLGWLGSLLGGTPTEPGLGFFLWGAAPLLAAIILKVMQGNRISLGMQPNLRGNGISYALSLLFYPLAVALVLGTSLALGVATWTPMPIDALIPTFAPLVVIYFLFAVFEEVGWRGALSAEVEKLNIGVYGHVLVGLIWAPWHFPYIRQLWSHYDESLVTLVPRLVLGAVLFSIVYGEIRRRTQSVWPAVLMHWIGNVFANGLLLTTVTLADGDGWLSSFGLEGVLMMGIAAAVGGYLLRQRSAQRGGKPFKTISHTALLLLLGCGAAAGQSADIVTCTVAYRSDVSQPIEREQTLTFAGNDDTQIVVFDESIFHAQFADGASDGERALRLWVTDSAETVTYQSHLYQLDQDTLPVNQFTGGHGFTGLTYSYPGSAEIQFWCATQ